MTTDNSDRLLYTLKSRGPLGTSTLARALGITEVGVRQHLAKLHGEGLAAFDDRAGTVGRPKRMWRLTAKGHARFPDTHGDLTVSLIAGIRSVFGEAGLDRLIEARQYAMVAAYRQALERYPDLGDRVGVLARLRTVEGYMAECEIQGDGSFLLDSALIESSTVNRSRCVGSRIEQEEGGWTTANASSVRSSSARSR